MNEKHQLSESLVCPQCGSNNDGASGLEEDEVAPPQDGDWAVCLYCGEILEYTNMVTVLKAVRGNNWPRKQRGDRNYWPS